VILNCRRYSELFYIARLISSAAKVVMSCGALSCFNWLSHMWRHDPVTWLPSTGSYLEWVFSIDPWDGRFRFYTLQQSFEHTPLDQTRRDQTRRDQMVRE